MKKRIWLLRALLGGYIMPRELRRTLIEHNRAVALHTIITNLGGPEMVDAILSGRFDYEESSAIKGDEEELCH